MTEFTRRGVTLRIDTTLVDGVPAPADLHFGAVGDVPSLKVSVSGGAPMSVGLRLTVTGMRAYLRNGYQSWDGSYWAAPGTPRGDEPAGKEPTLGFAATGFVPAGGDGVVMLGAIRHDRFQTRFRFGGTAETMTVDVETLLDGTGATEGEALVLFDEDDAEEGLRRWSHMVAAASPLSPRLPEKRITGWCSWYNHYAMIDEATIRAELESCRSFRDEQRVPLDVFLIDDGFTPEMGDWFDTRPQFPSGMEALVAEIGAAGFTPGLWSAPLLVGNRSKLFAAHPDWLIHDLQTGGPHIAMAYYGEFRWHKRSEEYYLLDITHPEVAPYLSRVFEAWRNWGVGYFKCDFLYYPMEHGPERLRHHVPGLSRVTMWRAMMETIRAAIGDATLLGCGCPLWSSVGLVDAVRIGRDIGVSMKGDYSGESLIRDQSTRRLSGNILWQADPDCILLRDRYHDLSDDEVAYLAQVAADTGGVLMTSDTLSALSPGRSALFAGLLRGAA